jgi:hypothetical protein
MTTHNIKLSFSLKKYSLGAACAQAILLIALLAPQDSHAQKGYPMPACAQELFDCAKDSAKTLGQSVLTVGNLLGAVVANGPCVAAMASGSPAAIGVTGLVLGLGAAGVVKPGSCEATFYGTALIPVTSALDAVLNTNLSSDASGMSLDAAMFLIKPIAVPALPPTIGELVNCGCGALDAGAKAVEDVRKVAKFAAQAYESCGNAIKSCPGLKEIAAVLKGAYQVITDPSSIVQSCESMSRQQYVDARLRDLIIPIREQFRNNIAWLGSNMDMNHLRPRLNACFKYYDSHCYKEDDAKNFCLAAVYTEVLDPLLWAAIIEEFNGPQFDKFFAENAKKLAPAAACPKDPGGTISLDPNTVGALEQGKAAQSANAKACIQDMEAMVFGETESMRSLARGMLPTTREGWDADVRQKFTEKPLDNAKKVFLRVMTAAAVVTKSKMAMASDKYKAQDTAVANSSEFAAVPYVVLNQQYGKWGNIIVKAIDDSCPKDPSGWNGKVDLTCVKELALAVGMSANEAASIKHDGVIVGAVAQSISNGSFKGSKYYNIASNIVLNGTPGAPPPIRVGLNTAEKETARYMARWPAAEAAATLAFAADLPALMGKQFARVAQEKAKRQEQEDIFAAMLRNNKIESDYAQTVCDRLKTGAVLNSLPMLCRGDISKAASAETSKFNVSRASAFLGTNNSAKPGTDAAMAKSVAEIKAAHDLAMKEYAAFHKQYGIDAERILMAGMTREGSSTPLVKVSTTPQGSRLPAGAGAVAAGGAATGSGGKPPEATIKNDGQIGSKPLGQIAGSPPAPDKPSGAIVAPTPGQGSVGIVSTAPRTGTLNAGNAGTVGMPGAPGMVVAVIPAPRAPQNTDLASSPAGKAPLSAAAVLPFDPAAYRKVREKQIEDEWMPKCAGQPQCLNKVNEITDKLLSAEITALNSGKPLHTDKAAVTAFQNSLDPIYDPQFQEALPKAVTAQQPTAQAITNNQAPPPKLTAIAPPFDAVAYRKDRAAILYPLWLTKCANNMKCLEAMAPILVKRIDVEASALTSGKPDHTDKSAVTAFQNSLDPIYNPQLQAVVPIVATTPSPPAGTGTISNKKPDFKPKI